MKDVDEPLASPIPTVWIMRTVNGGFYPIQPSDKCKPEDHGKLNDHVVSIEDVEGHVLWKRNASDEQSAVPSIDHISQVSET